MPRLRPPDWPRLEKSAYIQIIGSTDDPRCLEDCRTECLESGGTIAIHDEITSSSRAKFNQGSSACAPK